MDDDLKDMEDLNETLYKLRIENARIVKTPDWSQKDLEIVLKSLPNGKARDSLGHIFEIFKYCGRSLKMSVLRLANRIKANQVYPNILQSATLTNQRVTDFLLTPTVVFSMWLKSGQ